MSLQALPPEVFGMIAGFLADDHPPSLLNLAWTNKTYFSWCLPVAKSVFFHDTRITFGARNWLHCRVEDLVKKLKRADAFKHVRRLIIAHDDDNLLPSKAWDAPKLSDLNLCGYPNTYTVQHARLDRPPHELPWLDAESRIPALLNDNPDPQYAYNVWEPVVQLVQRLPALTDLIYRCYEQFPPLLLEALHRDKPQCRLHVQSYWLNTLDVPQTDCWEFELAKSPSLYSIMVRCPWERLSNRNPWSQEDAVLRVSTLAPNLKKVHIVYESPMQTQAAAARSAWPGFTQEERDKPRSLGALKSLSFSCQGVFSARKIAEWSQFTDLSALENLNTGPFVNDSFFRDFNGMGIAFASLKTLVLNIRGYPGTPPRSQFYLEAGDFLRGLPPLSELCLTGWHPFIPVDSIVNTHGSALRKLFLGHRVSRCLNEEELLLIGEKCPLLEEFTTMVRRTMGDSREVAVYRALGTIRKLKHLSLILDVSPVDLCTEEDDVQPWVENPEPDDSQVPNDPSFDSFDRKLCTEDRGKVFWARNGHVKQIIINSVIDDELARAIFQVISSAKPQYSPSLESVYIGTAFSWSLAPQLRRVFGYFEDSWRCVEYNFMKSRDKGLLVTVGEPTSEELLTPRERKSLPPWLETIFYRIWPRKGKVQPPRKQSKKLWKKLWAKREKEEKNKDYAWSFSLKSFPLATGS